MADVKMSSLPPASAIAGGELVPIVQGGQTLLWTVPADPIIEQSSDDIAFTGGAIDGVTLGGTAKTIGGSMPPRSRSARRRSRQPASSR